MNRSSIYVTRTGIQVGGAYVAPPPQPDHDALDLQRALIDQPSRGEVLLNMVDRWALRAMLALVAVGFVATVVKAIVRAVLS